MKKETRKLLLKWMIFLSVLGILTSIYLVKNHFVSLEEGSACDFSEQISCSLVNTSEYSEMFNVPVAIFGAFWFIILILMAWKALDKQGPLDYGIFYWNVFGILFVFYLIYAEFMLRAICPFCTLVHMIILITLVMSIMLFKARKKIKFNQIFDAAKPWIALVIIINFIPVIYFNLPEGEKVDYSNLTKCATANGVNMYGSYICAVCKKQREYLGDAFQYINEIECHPRGENPQTELCLEKDITKTPTWILEKDGIETKRIVGFVDAKTLAELSGCSLN